MDTNKKSGNMAYRRTEVNRTSKDYHGYLCSMQSRNGSERGL